jgi:hypothetical protein
MLFIYLYFTKEKHRITKDYRMANTVTFSFDEETVRKLGEIVGNGNKSERLRNLIQREWERLYMDGEAIHAPVNPYVAETD